jgi:hypothetical protein
MAIQDGFAPAGYWKREKLTCPASGSISSRPILMSQFRAAKYIITARKLSDNKIKYQEIVVLNDTGALTSSVGFKINSNFNLSIDETINAGNMELRFSTTEDSAIEIEMTYTNLGQ